MATLPADDRKTTPVSASVDAPVKENGQRFGKQLKQIPLDRGDRERIRGLAEQMAAGLDKSRPLEKLELAAHAQTILTELDLPDGYTGWTMVALGSQFWRARVQSVPYDRRMLLLPHCLKDAETCPAKYNEFGLICVGCGKCDIPNYKSMAEALGYKVLIAEGSPVVLQIILSGRIDAVLGVGCLKVLERSLDKILRMGLPSMAVPLHTNHCRDTATDEDRLIEMIETPYLPDVAPVASLSNPLQSGLGLFEADEIEQLIPRLRGGPSLAEANGDGLDRLDPIAATEAIAHDFLLRGGKHFRPFITMAAYDTMHDGNSSAIGDGLCMGNFPPSVKRIALAMEVFHKASLVHDDIEDDDGVRYGVPTVHRQYGTATAINVGDYLIGLGYRMIAAERETLPAEVVADITFRLSDAHLKLSEGQGAELAWRSAKNKRLTPLDTLKIYALKTSPAFDVALYAGIRLAGSAEPYREAAAKFARHLGVAFQIVNDLDDWKDDQPNKGSSGGDVLGGRPTVLWALALEGLTGEDRRELKSLIAGDATDSQTIDRVRALYDRADVFSQARALVDKHRQRALEVAESVEHDDFKELLRYFIDVILD